MITEEDTTINYDSIKGSLNYAKVGEEKEFKISYGVYKSLSEKWAPKDPERRGNRDILTKASEKTEDETLKEKITQIIEKVDGAKRFLDYAAKNYKEATKKLSNVYKNKEIADTSAGGDTSKVNKFFGFDKAKRAYQKMTASPEYLKKRSESKGFVLKTSVSPPEFEVLDEVFAGDQNVGDVKVYSYEEAVSIGFDIKLFLDNRTEENAKDLVKDFLSYRPLFKGKKSKKSKATPSAAPDETESTTPEVSEKVSAFFTELDEGLGEGEATTTEERRIGKMLFGDSAPLKESENELKKYSGFLELAKQKGIEEEDYPILLSLLNKIKKAGKIQDFKEIYKQIRGELPSITFHTAEELKNIFQPEKIYLIAQIGKKHWVGDDLRTDLDLSYKIKISDALRQDKSYYFKLEDKEAYQTIKLNIPYHSVEEFVKDREVYWKRAEKLDKIEKNLNFSQVNYIADKFNSKEQYPLSNFIVKSELSSDKYIYLSLASEDWSELGDYKQLLDVEQEEEEEGSEEEITDIKKQKEYLTPLVGKPIILKDNNNPDEEENKILKGIIIPGSGNYIEQCKEIYNLDLQPAFREWLARAQASSRIVLCFSDFGARWFHNIEELKDNLKAGKTEGETATTKEDMEEQIANKLKPLIKEILRRN